MNLRPYYTEGAKTFGFEIAEQLGWQLPRHTVVPTAGGTILPKIWKAYQELIDLGLVEDNQPKIYSAQAAGAIRSSAIHKGDDIIPAAEAQHHRQEHRHRQPRRRLLRLDVVRNPADGATATDREIVDAIKLLARTEGIWTEPAGGTTLAARSS